MTRSAVFAARMHRARARRGAPHLDRIAIRRDDVTTLGLALVDRRRLLHLRAVARAAPDTGCDIQVSRLVPDRRPRSELRARRRHHPPPFAPGPATRLPDPLPVDPHRALARLVRDVLRARRRRRIRNRHQRLRRLPRVRRRLHLRPAGHRDQRRRRHAEKENRTAHHRITARGQACCIPARPYANARGNSRGRSAPRAPGSLTAVRDRRVATPGSSATLRGEIVPIGQTKARDLPCSSWPDPC